MRFALEGTPIPLRCPKCEGKLIAVKYSPFLKVLKDRGWHFCNECGFQQSVEKFKKMLLTV